MKIVTRCVLLCFLLGVSLKGAVLITTFGSSADSFGLGGGWVWNQNTSALSGTEASGDLLFNNNTLSNLTGNNAISITANVTTAPAFGFTFLLEDSVGKTASALFNWADFIGGATVVRSLSIDSGFNFADVQNWNLVSGASNTSISAILTSASAVSAVPEPSTYAAIVGIAALGFCAVRRRRKL